VSETEEEARAGDVWLDACGAGGDERKTKVDEEAHEATNALNCSSNDDCSE
jgi:hypothetical protein